MRNRSFSLTRIGSYLFSEPFILIITCILIIPLFHYYKVNLARTKVDLIVLNARIYTVDSAFSTAEAMAVKGGRIIDIGTGVDLLKSFQATETLDAKGKFIYPGFIDAHAHFFRYALALNTVDLTGTASWQEVIQRLKAFAAEHKTGWLTGRGWDQNDWDQKEFPSREMLDQLFPDRPVMLARVDGHAAIVNKAALDIAGVKVGDFVVGGQIESKDGKLTGILVDNAMRLVSQKMTDPELKEVRVLLSKAEQNCFSSGLTTVDDCGIDFGEALLMDSLQKAGELKMRIYAMLSDDKANYDFLFRNGRIKTDKMNVRAFKVYADGALGSRGACLIDEYADKPEHHGFLLSSAAHYDSVAGMIQKNGFQMCTHAIGDSGNRTILNIYAKHLKGKNELRWRIEHAQVINTQDFDLFGTNSVIPSVQPTHATSDMYWAGQRIGKEREKGAYAYKQLLKQNGWIPLGTDFPVEDISPVKTFYAATVRKDAKGWPGQGYQPENALTREEALKGITIWAAKSNFEEKEKGSLEKGKFADFVMLDTDLLTAEPSTILKTRVLLTCLNGERVYEYAPARK